MPVLETNPSGKGWIGLRCDWETDKIRSLTVYEADCDGFGAVIFRGTEHIWQCSEVYCPKPGREHQTSNNLAEYCGLIAVLEHFIEMGAQHEPIMVYGDSNLVIQQMFGRWKIRDGIYAPFAEKALELRGEFTSLGGKWIPRDENAIADCLSKAHIPETDVDFRF